MDGIYELQVLIAALKQSKKTKYVFMEFIS